MDLIFQPTTGEQFTLLVGHFDTVLKIKEQIQKEQGIPVSTQTLVFDGDVLDDELELFDSDIIHGSHIQLIIEPDNVLDHSQLIDAPNPAKRSISTEESSSSSKKIRLPIKKPVPEKHSIKTEESSTHFEKIVLRFKMPSSEPPLEIEMDTNDTIRSVKERLQEMGGNAMSRFILRANGIELHDDKTINDSALHQHSEIEISIEQLSTTDLPGPSGDVTDRAKKLRVSISICGFKRISLLVNPNDEVAELRKELDKLNIQDSELDLPPGFFFNYKYIFMHNGSVMKDDRSFIWHNVKEDDLIQIVPGRAESES